MAANAVKNFKQYDYISRYESFPYYYDKVNNRYYYGLSANLIKTTPYASYTVQAGDSYDSIAYDKYGNALFYWVICYFNNVPDSFEDPIPGTVIKLPSLNSIIFKE